jgi:hypothetical protein
VLARTGATPLLVSTTHGQGRVFYIGVDELWRTRYDVGDRYFWRFYRGAIDWLSEPKIERAPPPGPPPVPGVEAIRALAQASGGRVVGLDAAASPDVGPAFWRPTRRRAAEGLAGAFGVAAGFVLAGTGLFLLRRREAP